MKTPKLFVAAVLAAIATSAAAQTKWDMPTPYPATNFHTENIAQFADDKNVTPETFAARA